ncbi:MAG: tyrosine-type recombinase/integrase [Hyphomicrobiaceae bacterium]
MAKEKITQRTIDSLRRKAASDGKPMFLWDTELQGFGAKVWPSGQVSWVVQKWLGGRGGKATRVAIGRYPPVDLEAARKKAGSAISDVHDGKDLISEREINRRRLRELQQAAKFGETVELYLQRKTQPGRFWAELAGRFEREIIPTIGKDTRVASITKADMRHMIEAKEETHPVAARTLFEALRPFLKWCVERDIITVSPLQDLSPPPVPPARERTLTDDEMRSFWSATFKMGWPFCPVYRLLLLTAQRRDEVAGMRRSEIDLTKAEWIIPGERTKNGKEHLVHLSPQAVSILEHLPVVGDLVFTSTGTTPPSGFSRAKSNLDAFMLPAKPWRIHDLRRTAATG